MRYFGGKWRLAPWIISHFPKHRIYVEPFGGAGSVLLRKERAYAEVYNDTDADVVNLFRQARDNGDKLVRALALTPFSRDEFGASHDREGSPLERARRMVVRSYQGFAADSVTSRCASGFRANSNRSGSTPAHDWARYPDALRMVCERLRGVVIENRPATQVMEAHDGPETLHYVDPPYVHDTRQRVRSHGYAHEMTDADHEALVTFLQGLKGMVVLSGYAHPIYDEALRGWSRVDTRALADGALERTESLWLSPSVSNSLTRFDPFGLES